MADPSKNETPAETPAETVKAEQTKAKTTPVPGLIVRGPRGGRWRAGRHFGPQDVTLAPGSLTAEEVAAIEDDKSLHVQRLP